MANIMDKFTQFLEEKLMPVAVKVANQRHLAAIKDEWSLHYHLLSQDLYF